MPFELRSFETPSSAQELLACIQKWDAAVQRAMREYAAAKAALNSRCDNDVAKNRFERKAEDLQNALESRNYYQNISDQMRRKTLSSRP
ncbi:hypothetical protein [Roseomonas sp. USHLN139]|uniref:hypothetical protein n=1 Tax=Roseomonas sp. USHLN139 TaxID=3081298 RepID=UPI003B0277AE